MDVCCFSDLKPQLEDAERRLDEAKTKQADVMKELETVQNNLNFTLSTHVKHTHQHNRSKSLTMKKTVKKKSDVDSSRLFFRPSVSAMNRCDSGDQRCEACGGCGEHHGHASQRCPASNQRAAGPMAADLRRRQRHQRRHQQRPDGGQQDR